MSASVKASTHTWKLSTPALTWAVYASAACTLSGMSTSEAARPGEASSWLVSACSASKQKLAYTSGS